MMTKIKINRILGWLINPYKMIIQNNTMNMKEKKSRSLTKKYKNLLKTNKIKYP